MLRGRKPPPHTLRPLSCADLTFDATYIYVYGGTFTAGTEDKPFLNRLTITLHGDRYNTVEIPNVGAKCLAVMSVSCVTVYGASLAERRPRHARVFFCFASQTMKAVSGYGSTEFGVQAITWPPSTAVLDLHGKPRMKVWTRLSASAMAGETLIRTVESVDFAPGETIVVTFIGDMKKSERVVVAALIDENTVQLTAPLKFDHVGKIVPAQSYGFDDIYMFPEVGLLSRNIIVQGDKKSDEQLFGIHTGAFMGGVYRIENVELQRCGQQGALGRYCTHVHMVCTTPPNYCMKRGSCHSLFPLS